MLSIRCVMCVRCSCLCAVRCALLAQSMKQAHLHPDDGKNLSISALYSQGCKLQMEEWQGFLLAQYFLPNTLFKGGVYACM